MKVVNRILMLGFTLIFSCTGAAAATFTVNTVNDTADFSPGNGVYMDNMGACSFRAAILPGCLPLQAR